MEEKTIWFVGRILVLLYFTTFGLEIGGWRRIRFSDSVLAGVGCGFERGKMVSSANVRFGLSSSNYWDFDGCFALLVAVVVCFRVVIKKIDCSRDFLRNRLHGGRYTKALSLVYCWTERP